MHKRTAHRWRISATIMVGFMFALGSFWLVQLMHNGDAELAAEARKNEPDYIVEKFSFVRMTPEGTPRYIIAGAKLTHHPIDDTADIDLPVVQSLAADKPPMTINARTARVDNVNSQVHLAGDVVVDRKASPLGEALQMKTEALTVFPDDDKLTSDRPVAIVVGHSTLNGTGLLVDNAARQLSLSSKVHIVYPPPQRQTDTSKSRAQ
ncbi:MAG: LPS export ABC transporter periplasmic protein LptC [Pseudomonadota bacterium]